MASPPDDAERLRARERPSGRPRLRQVWRHLGFLHWPVDEAALARLLPPGLEIDTYEGRAYVGIVPFTIPLTRTAALALPLAPSFHELNLRTYVHRAGRDPGVWFFSLDATSPWAVAGARLGYGLPYFHARMSLVEARGAAAPEIAYASERRGAVPAHFSGGYRPTGMARAAAPGSLEFFLLERYLLYAQKRSALRSARVHHDPYPVQVAEAADVNQTLLRAAGLPEPVGPPPLVHYAQQVDVRIWPPRAATSGRD